ncbi:protein JBTS17 isoform X2 [Lingula anatina]|uniref:Protein JBTS17 isoform X2 n=1 Tax=Lingula anatina TaxID=7574 RepID=A0A1S3IFG0_LINAN|nr:protein JBTS17 isoform X2 [Lingula anatina]|eukprot:XP_013396199.1 protein JBTS17 isoform X2 [Lingula anatina]
MKLELEVLASTAIKRKKPWPRFAWLGESSASLFLLDTHRASVLFLPSGKTKKKVPKLHQLLEDTSALNHSDNGHFLVGLLKSGDVFLWHKDKALLKIVHGVPDLVNQGNGETSIKPSIFISNDARRILVVIGRRTLFLWELNHKQNVFAPRQADVQGTWSCIQHSYTVELPMVQCKETSISAVFYQHQVIGDCLQCSFAFSGHGMLIITTVLFRWFEQANIYTLGQPTYSVQWTMLQVPWSDLGPRCKAIRSKGAVLACQSHGGHVLAVAVNQKRSHDTKILFVSPLTDTVIATDMEGCGARAHREGRSYWISDLKWTSDDLFVVCMTKQGFLCVLSRLGEPVHLQTSGCSVEMGPAQFLPLHPLISISPTRQQENVNPSESQDSVHSDKDLMRQRFSVAIHPKFPVFLCSDGYLVTVLQLADNVQSDSVELPEQSYVRMVKGFLKESNQQLRKIKEQQNMQLTLGGTMNLTLKDTVRSKSKKWKQLGLAIKATSTPAAIRNKNKFKLEELEGTLNTTLGSEASLDGNTGKLTPFGPALNMESGKVIFAEQDAFNATSESMAMLTLDPVAMTQQAVDEAQVALLSAWNLIVSCNLTWTVELERTAFSTLLNIVKLISAILKSPPEASLSAKSRPGAQASDGKLNPRLLRVLQIVRKVLAVLSFDTLSQNLIPCSLRFVQRAVHCVLHSTESLDSGANKGDLIRCALAIVMTARTVLDKVYTWLPCRHERSNGTNFFQQACCTHVVEPAVMVGRRRRGYRLEGFSEVEIVEGEALGNPPAKEEDGGDKMVVQPLAEEDGGRSQTREKKKGKEAPLPTSEEDGERNMPVVVFQPLKQTTNGPSRRLSPTLKKLLKHIAKHLSSLISSNAKGSEIRKAKQLVCTAQRLLQAWNGSCETHKHRRKVQEGDKLSIVGAHEQALEKWEVQLAGLEGPHRTRLQLAILFTTVLKGDLSSALEQAEGCVRYARGLEEFGAIQSSTLPDHISQDPAAGEEIPFIGTGGCRSVVLSLARFMAAYFTNGAPYVFPPHSPQPLPYLHLQESQEFYRNGHCRQLTIEKRQITDLIKLQSLSSVFTPEWAMEYLLLCGSLAEAVWFASKMGDWKTAFVLSVACSIFRKIKPDVNVRAGLILGLPVDLKPMSIMKAMFRKLLRPVREACDKRGENSEEPASLQKTPSVASLQIDDETNLDQLTRTMNDLLMAGALAKVDITPWLLGCLLDRLKVAVASFPTLVPQGVYLPAPPLYCPQPAVTSEEEWSEEVREEMIRRKETSSLIQLITVVMRASHTALPAAVWYVKELAPIQDILIKGERKDTLVTLPDTLTTFQSLVSVIDGHTDHWSTLHTLACFRDFCGLVWLLHVREKLSVALRKDYDVLCSKEYLQTGRLMEETDWLNQCTVSLNWALHMLPFSHFLQNESDIYDIVLSVLKELQPTQDVADILAEHFRHLDDFDPELQDKVERTLKEWQGIFLDSTPSIIKERSNLLGKSPKGKTLSTYYHKQVNHYERVLERKKKLLGAYDEFVSFVEDENAMGKDATVIGSRPHEREEAFIDFLDTFYAITFSKLLDSDEVHQRPLLSPFASELRKQELGSLAHKAVLSLQLKHQFTSTASDSKPPESPSPSTGPPPAYTIDKDDQSMPTPSSSKRPSGGLFRSQSHTNISGHSQEGNKVTIVTPITKKRFDSSGQENGTDSSNTVVKNKQKVSFKGLSKAVAGLHPRKSRSLTDLTGKSSGRQTPVTPIIQQGRSLSDLRPSSRSGSVTPSSARAQASPRFKWFLHTRLNYSETYTKVSQLLEWLTRWAGKHHSFSIMGDVMSESKITVRVKVHPQMILHSLWLLENKYYPEAPGQRDDSVVSKQIQVRQGERPRKGGKQGKISEMKWNKNGQDFTVSSTRIQKPEKPFISAKDQPGKTSPNVKAMTNEQKWKAQDATSLMNAHLQRSKPRVSWVTGYDSVGNAPQLAKNYMTNTYPPIGGAVSPFKTDLSGNQQSLLPATKKPTPPLTKQDEVVSFDPESESTTTGPVPAKKLSFQNMTESFSRERTGGTPEDGAPEDDSSTLDVSSLAEDEVDVVGSTMKSEKSQTLAVEDLTTTRPSQSNVPQPTDQPLRGDIENQQQIGALGTQQLVGLTNASQQLSGNVDLVQQLQNVVRGEFRRIMEIQQSSLLAMMGAIDVVSSQSAVTSTGQTVAPSIGMVPQHQKTATMQLPHQVPHLSGTESRSREAGAVETGNMVEVNTQTTPQPAGRRSRSKSSDSNTYGTGSKTEQSSQTVTPTQVVGGESRSGSKSLKQREKESRAIFGGALRELQNLQEETRHSPQGRHQGHAVFGLGGVGRGVIKEDSLLSKFPLLRLPGIGEKENAEATAMFAGQPRIPNMLRLAAEKETDAQLLRFPKFPAQNPEGPQQPKGYTTHAPMPILRRDDTYQASQLMRGYFRPPSSLPHDVRQYAEGTRVQSRPPNVSMTAPQVHNGSTHPLSQRLGIQLLHLTDDHPMGPHRFLGARDSGAIYPGVPAETLIEYEQQKRQKELLKQEHLKAFQRQAMTQHAQNQQRELGSVLLKVDFDHLTNRDQQDQLEKKEEIFEMERRNDIKRKKRRQKKKEIKDASSTESEQISLPSNVIRVTPRTTEVPPTKTVDTSSSQQPIRVTVSSSAVQTEEADEETVLNIHSGFAIPPGTFDHYLDHPSADSQPTNASLHYKATQGVKPRKKVEFATMTTDLADSGTMTEQWEEEPRYTAEAATSITRDTGTDPVKEAVDDYFRATRPSMLPPDIFLGLRFGDIDGDSAEHSAPSTGGKGQGRSYINVIDMDGASIDDLIASVQEKGSVDEPRRPIDQIPERDTTVTSPPKPSIRSSLLHSPGRRTEELSPGPDPLTSRMLAPTQMDRNEEEVMVPLAVELSKQSRQQSKAGIARRLQEMNQQLKAIDVMSQNMETDFKNTRLLLHTVESLGEALTPETRQSEYPPARVAQQPQQVPGDSLEPPVPLRPSDVKRMRSDDQMSTVQADEERAVEDGLTNEDRIHAIRERLGKRDQHQRSIAEEEEKADSTKDLTGVSGVSDIIGELLNEGEIGAEELGLSQTEAKRMADKAKKSDRLTIGDDFPPTDLSLEQMEDIFNKPSPRDKGRMSPEKRKQLHEWSAKKRHERLEQYKKEKEELRERERTPYKPPEGVPVMATSTFKEIKTVEKKREEEKKQRLQEFTEKREKLAHQLMSDIVADKLDLPKEEHEITERTEKRQRRPTSKAAGTPTKKKKPATAPPGSRQGYSIPNRQRAVQGQDQDRLVITSEDYLTLEDNYDDMIYHKYPQGSPETFNAWARPRTYEGTGQLSDIREAEEVVHKPEASGHRPVIKSYTDLVKVQRPEVTRRKPSPVPHDKSQDYLGATQTISKPKSSSLKSLQRLFGTKRIPGLQKTQVRESPRVVKTYTERLQEMKKPATITPGRGSDTPQSRRLRATTPLHTTPSRQHGIRPERGPRRNTLTYAQQLQQLSPPKKHTGRGSSAGIVTPRTTPSLRSHRPAHKPKTYSQQLQELQAKAPHGTYRAAYSPTPSIQYQTPPLRSLVRPRPYADPYRPVSEPDISEADSVVSPWSVDEDVKRILYDGQEGIAAGGASVYAESDDLDYLTGADYTNAVDIADIEGAATMTDLASVSSGSIMSVIDWDQVDQIIADVK